MQTVFTGTLFDVAVINLWNVQNVLTMDSIFGDPVTGFGLLSYEPLCGYGWVSNRAAQLQGVKTTEAPCDYCRPGEYYRPLLLKCFSCTNDGEYTLGGQQESCSSCQELGPEHYCNQGEETFLTERVDCPTKPGFACFEGVRLPHCVRSLSAPCHDCSFAFSCCLQDITTSLEPGLYEKCDETSGSCSLHECSLGYHCPGDKMQYLCDVGTHCPARSTAPSPCAAGYFCKSPKVQAVCVSTIAYFFVIKFIYFANL